MALACAERGIGYLAYSPFGGPDFSSGDAWRMVCGEALREYEDGFRADLEPVSDPAFDGAPWEVVRAARTPAESAAVRRAGDDVGGRYPCGTGGMLLTMSIAFSDRTESQ